MSRTGLSLHDSHINIFRKIPHNGINLNLDKLDDVDDHMEEDEDDDTMTSLNDNAKDQIDQIDSNEESSKERVIAASLGSIIQYENKVSASNSLSITEAWRRRLLSQHTVRFVAETMAIINVLSNMLATLYLQDCIAQSLPVSPMVADKCTTFWNWTVGFVTTNR